MAYGGSQARGGIGAVATGLRHSHSNSGSKLCLQPTPQLHHHQMGAASATYTTAHGNAGSLTHLSEARDQTLNLMVTSRIR